MSGTEETADAAEELRRGLQGRLREAMRAREQVTVSALRAVLAAIDNAGAVAVSVEHVPTFGHSNEVPRRRLSRDQVAALVRREAESRTAAAEEHRRLGLTAEAERLEREAAVVLGCLV